MKKVLMVVYSFPPIKNAESDRSLSFVGQLHNCGWEPLVLTREVRSQPAEESDFRIPEGIDVVRSSPWRPDPLPKFLRVAASFLASLMVPDRERLWELFSLRKASRITKNDGIDLVYTVSPPSSSHIIGLHLKKKYPDVPWVADICSTVPVGQMKLKDRYEKKLLEKVLSEADCIITGSETIQEQLKHLRSKNPQEESISLVPDGHVQELSELFEKACRVIAARKMVKNSNE